MTRASVVLLSVRSPHVERLLEGTKTVELRRRLSVVSSGTTVLLYASGKRRALVGSFVAGAVERDTPRRIWKRHGAASALNRAEFDRYFLAAEHATAVEATAVVELAKPIDLDELRQRWPGFLVPQSSRRLGSDELAGILNGERSELLGGLASRIAAPGPGVEVSRRPPTRAEHTTQRDSWGPHWIGSVFGSLLD